MAGKPAFDEHEYRQQEKTFVLSSTACETSTASHSVPGIFHVNSSSFFECLKAMNPALDNVMPYKSVVG